jgi:hypothetical protein
VTVGHGAANKLIVTTQPSDGTAGVAWATQPVVTLQDAYGNTVLGTAQTVTVAFNANPGGATLFGTAVLALDIGTGQAVFTDLSIRKAAANYRLTATGDTVSTTAGQVLSGYFTISPGPAAQLAFTTQPGNSTVGALLSVQPVITLQDQFGNTVVGTAQTVTLAIQNNPNGNATLQGTTTVALSTIMGTANFSGLFLDWIGTGYTLTATGNAVSTTPGTAVSAAFDIAKGNPAVSWSNPADIVDGTALSATQLNAVASLPGTFAYTPPAGTVLPLGNGQTLSVQFTPTDGVNYNQATKQVTINVIPPPPSITIPATGPVTASAGQPFSYAIQAGGAQPMTFQVTGLPARLTLDGATISGQPTVVGTFNVTITATNSSGTDTKTLTLTFTAPDISGPGQSSADTDGDGFPDELETELGNSAIDSQSTPIANQPAPPIAASGVTKLGVKLNFGKPTATSDSLSLSGVLLPPAGFVAGGQTVVVDIGGVIRSYVLTTKGGSTDRQLKIGKPSKKDGKSKYSVRMKGSFASSLADEGLANEEIKIAQPVTVPVYIIFDTNWYGEQKSALYKARLNKTGSAK